MMHILIVSALFELFIRPIDAHSWPDNIAGGMCRGCSPGLSDLVRQRYYCPFASLSQCTPPANSGVVLTAENLRPCRTSPSMSSPMGNAVAGQPMYVHWAGNGHTGSQSTGTCVSVSIAPYAVDPDRSAFTTIASCLPYSHDGVLTDAYVTLPSNLAAGMYTVFWLWDFAGFWFSGCTDINVSSSGGATTTNSPATTTRPPASTTTTVSTTSRATTSASTTTRTPSTTTRTTNSPATTTRPPASTTTTVSTTSRATTSASTTTRTPSTTTRTTLVPSTTKPATGGTAADCKKYTLPNTQCKALYGSNSYCASWASDKCGYSHCLGERYSDATCPPKLL